jgi:hypothetical protein
MAYPALQPPCFALVVHAWPCCVAASLFAGVSAGWPMAAHGWVEPRHAQAPDHTLEAAGESRDAGGGHDVEQQEALSVPHC